MTSSSLCTLVRPMPAWYRFPNSRMMYASMCWVLTRKYIVIMCVGVWFVVKLTWHNFSCRQLYAYGILQPIVDIWPDKIETVTMFLNTILGASLLRWWLTICESGSRNVGRESRVPQLIQTQWASRATWRKDDAVQNADVYAVWWQYIKEAHLEVICTVQLN